MVSGKRSGWSSAQGTGSHVSAPGHLVGRKKEFKAIMRYLKEGDCGHCSHCVCCHLANRLCRFCWLLVMNWGLFQESLRNTVVLQLRWDGPSGGQVIGWSFGQSPTHIQRVPKLTLWLFSIPRMRTWDRYVEKLAEFHIGPLTCGSYLWLERLNGSRRFASAKENSASERVLHL